MEAVFDGKQWDFLVVCTKKPPFLAEERLIEN